MTKIDIRPVVAEDIPAIVNLLKAFAEYENLLRYCTVTEEALFKAAFDPGGFVEMLAAFDTTEMMGYAIFYPCFASFRGQSGYYLEDIYIRDQYRGRGIGKMMLQTIARRAKSRGFQRIDFQVLEWNAPAIEFYEKLGARRDEDERHYKFTDEAFEALTR